MPKAKRRGLLNKSDLRAQIWDKTQGHCWYCGRLMNPWRDFSIDRVIPFSQGGTEDPDNLVPCCRQCNSSKGDRYTYDEFLARKRQWEKFIWEHRASLEVEGFVWD
jgi:5-methylcytosine-specific restriction endonuclease McrA